MLNYIRYQASRAHVRMPTKECLYKRGHHSLHTAYFGLASIETHGIHAIITGSLFLLSIGNALFLHYEDA